MLLSSGDSSAPLGSTGNGSGGGEVRWGGQTQTSFYCLMNTVGLRGEVPEGSERAEFVRFVSLAAAISCAREFHNSLGAPCPHPTPEPLSGSVLRQALRPAWWDVAGAPRQPSYFVLLRSPWRPLRESRGGNVLGSMTLLAPASSMCSSRLAFVLNREGFERCVSIDMSYVWTMNGWFRCAL